MSSREKRGSLLAPNELSGFCAQIAMLLNAGITVSEGVGIMLQETEEASGRRILSEIHTSLEEGMPFCQALEKTGAFPRYVVNMTEIGERTGRLDNVMDSMTAFYEREEAIRQSVKSAVAYPMVMVLVMLAVIGLLVVKVLPVFSGVYRDLGGELDGFAKAVMDMGMIVSGYAFVIIGVLAALVVFYLALRSTGAGRRLGERIKNWFPPTRSINNKIVSGRFASAMSLMTSSGLDTGESLDMVYRLSESSLMREKIADCKKRIAEGSGLAEALVAAGLFTGVYARMVTIGFKSGAIDTVMEKLADRYEDEIEAGLNGIIAILEPTLVAVLSIMVGLILLSVMLPLMGVMSAIG